MKPSQYQKLAARTECDQQKAGLRITTGGLTATRLLHAAIGLSGEVGEFAYAIEKAYYYGQSLSRDNVMEELADILWYVALACNACGMDMGAVMEAGIAKLKQRYPEKYTDELAEEPQRDRAAELEAMRSKMCRGGECGS